MSQANENHKKRALVRLPPALYAAVRQRSLQRMRSVNNEIIVLLKLGMANEMEEAAALTAADKMIDVQTARIGTNASNNC